MADYNAEKHLSSRSWLVSVEGAVLRGSQIGTDQVVSWANSAAANTQKVITFAKPADPVGEYELIVYNPSTVTDLTVKIFAVEPSLGGADRDGLITEAAIPKAATKTGTSINTDIHFVHGMFNGANCKLILSNDTALGASDGFDAYVRLREVG